MYLAMRSPTPGSGDFRFRRQQVSAAAGSTVAMDALVLAAIARDLIVQRRIRRVYAIGLPLPVAQLTTWELWRAHAAWWRAILHAMVD